MDHTLPTLAAEVAIRPLREIELDEAERIFRLAFGTFLGLPDPSAFMSGAALLHARWRADASAALAADLHGTLIGSNYATNWGSVGFFGPLTVRPELWDRGIGQRLLDDGLRMFRDWGTPHVGLFTFPHSPKHIGLYQKFGFWPRSLTAVMRRRVQERASGGGAALLSEVDATTHDSLIDACLEAADAVQPGLDLRHEIRAARDNGSADTVLLQEGSRVVGFAVCHCGPCSEAESGTCYVKFGLCSPGPQAQARFTRLLDGCDRFARERGAEWLSAGANAARRRAYGTMLDGGFRPQIFGIAMHRHDDPGYNREDAWVVDDWR
ncbi:MAG: GNAT family N-acetyltransferase [Burkholderiaceae bacterium]|jgi:GNAT superfamily N-acetyltransferase|nr:GNAT family N-acetyltransferase [Burkholderiaceae bacterium]